MNQELEIEYKNILTHAEYSRLFDAIFKNNVETSQNISQTNYYFDTMETVLRSHGSILRVRVADAFNELTFKVPSQGFLMESNYFLSDRSVKEIIQKKRFVLSSFLSPSAIIPELEGFSKETEVYLFNQFKTERWEQQVGDHLIVLDETTFQNGIVDYELEVESADAETGLIFFNHLLNKHAISQKETLPKIARAEKNK